MDNHFHLMVDDPFDNLSKAMQRALTAYAKYFNRKTGRTGHLFDNRYSRVAVESDTQAVQLYRRYKRDQGHRRLEGGCVRQG